MMDSSQNAATAGTGVGGNGMIISQGNDTAATAVDDPKQNLNQVINSIQKTLGLLHQLYLTVSSFNAASQLPLLQCLYLSAILCVAIYSFIVTWFTKMFISVHLILQQFSCYGARQHG
jgi:hypothetical protein